MKHIPIYFLLLIPALLPTPRVVGEEGSPINLSAGALENLQLAFAEATPSAVQQSIQATGTVKLNEKRVVEVTPRISGMVVSDPRSLGDRVKQGDELCKLQSADLSGKLTAYVAAEEAMRFAAAAVEQERNLAQKQLSSIEQLREKEQNLKQAVAEHAKALQPLKLLDFVEATVHEYLDNVHGSDYTSLTIKAPEAGEIIAKEVRRGAAVEMDQSLFTIADLSELWVDFFVSLRDVAPLKIGNEVRVDSSVSNSQRAAKIIYISPVADERSRSILVRAVIDNRDGAWRPGTPVTVFSTSTAGTGPAELAVPTSALVDFHGGKAVFIRTGETAFLPVPVKTGMSDGVKTQILSGLKAKQIVVSRNAAQLKGHLEMTAGE